ncbi:MAG: hypothetical protein ACFFBD_12140 [Candidatus Hodarchaeota archaeon]
MLDQRDALQGRRNSQKIKPETVCFELEGIGPNAPDFRDLKPGIALFSETLDPIGSQGSLFSIVYQLQQEIAELKRKNEDLENKIKKLESYLKEKHNITIEEALREFQQEEEESKGPSEE